MQDNDNNENNAKPIVFRYVFQFDTGLEKEFILNIDRKTLLLIQKDKDFYPEWVNLEKFKCPNCPLDKNRNKYCPIAKNLSELIVFFQDMYSYEQVNLLIETEERKYIKRTPLQEGLSSLIGVYMVTSGCPILEKLKPLVRYHLPFSTVEETTYRVVTMYLLSQYFLYRKGKKTDWDMHNLAKIYEEIQIVNRNFFQKISDNITKDASVNAIAKLHCTANYMSFRLNTNVLDEIENFFNAYCV